MKKLIIFGSTGSIGVQTLDILKSWGWAPVALTAGRNVDLLERQAREFRPQMVAVADKTAAAALRVRLADTGVVVSDNLFDVLDCECDMVLNAIVGVAGLPFTLAAIAAGRDVALANKESLVVGGEYVMQAVQRKGVALLPVDSEHSAIFQCLQGAARSEVKNITLTASGGPFYGKSRGQLAAYTAADALAHPTWNMGAKITVDCATMMNKGLELIEAMRLFGLAPQDIGVTVHRQSIVHSMVTFCDGATLAQLGVADMRVPIAYALSYPRRLDTPVPCVDWSTASTLTFAPPDEQTFGCLRLAKQAAAAGQAACVVLNAANEVAVADFLAGRVGFLDIEALVAQQLAADWPAVASADDCLALDAEVRKKMGAAGKPG